MVPLPLSVMRGSTLVTIAVKPVDLAPWEAKLSEEPSDPTTPLDASAETKLMHCPAWLQAGVAKLVHQCSGEAHLIRIRYN
jgi:hypothetical protein